VLPYVKYMYLGLTEQIKERYDEAVQRLRLRFSRGEELRYISHLDLMRLWERALRRGEIPLIYSEGYSPHPRLSLAAPLPIGVTSEAELMDMIVHRSASAHFVMRNVRQQLPRGLDILELSHVPLAAPSLQSQVRYAEYRVAVVEDKNAEEIRTAIDSLLRTRELPWQHMRDTGPRFYDLRTLIEHTWLESCHGLTFTLGMKLRCGPQGTGRPEQVTAALGLTQHPLSIHRTKLILAEN
jgi:radical SAM-linked protein